MIILQNKCEIFVFQKKYQYFIFDSSVHPLISGTKSGTSARVRLHAYLQILTVAAQCNAAQLRYQYY